MNPDSVKYFYLLKKEIEKTYKEAYPYCNKPINEWKGQEITNFQEELQQKVSDSISEKWFYTHIKPQINNNNHQQDTM